MSDSSVLSISKSLNSISQAVNANNTRINPDAIILTTEIIKDPSIDFDSFGATYRKISATDADVFTAFLQQPTPSFAEIIRQNGKLQLFVDTNERLVRIAQEQAAREFAELQEQRAEEAVATAEEIVRQVSAAETVQIEAQQKVIAEQNAAAERANQLQKLQAHEIARRANEIDTPKFTDTLIGSIGKDIVVGVAKGITEVAAAALVGPAIGLALK